MAFVSNPSSSEDNNTGTDISNIHTEEEEHVDTTTWTPTKQKKTTIYGRIPCRISTCFW